VTDFVLIHEWITNHRRIRSESDSEFRVTTDGQSASLSWNKAPIWGLRPDFYYRQTVSGFLMWSVLYFERTGLSFTIAAGLASAVILGSKSSGTRDHMLLSQSRDLWIRSSLYDCLNSLAVTMENVCCLSADTEKRSVPSRCPGIHISIATYVN
jgi:hypothetical protein